MTTTTFFVVFLQTAVCLSAALLICALARKSSGVRLLVSQTAILVCTLFLVVARLSLTYTPFVPVSVPEAVAFSLHQTNDEATPAKVVQSPATEVQAATTETGPVVQPEPVYESISSFTISRLVSLTYGLGVIVTLLPMMFGALWIRRVRRNCRPVTGGSTFDVLNQVSARRGIRVPMLFTSEAITIPFVSGLRRKQIFVPTDWVDGQCDIGCQAIIEHEVAHIVTRDLESKFLCRIACSFLWFQPLAWFTFKVMANASEEQCDESVLLSGVGSADYANTLLRIRENAKGNNVFGLVIGAVSRQSNLAKRMMLILSSDERKIKRSSRLVLWMSVLCLAITTGVSQFVFGQSSFVSQQAPPTGPYSGVFQLVDWLGNPLKNAKAYLVVRKADETLNVEDLQVKGSKLVLSEPLVSGTITGTLFIVNGDGSQDMVRLWPAESRITTVSLARPATIRGTLTSKLSNTFPATVFVRAILRERPRADFGMEYLELGASSQMSKVVQTDKEGNFSISGLPSNATICLDVRDEHIAVDSMLMRVKVDAMGNSGKFKFELKEAGRISGHVYQDGKPVVGMKIAAQGQKKYGWGESVTDSLGAYRIDRLVADSYNVAGRISEIDATKFTIRAHEGVNIREGQLATGMDFELVPGGIISGTLTDPSGKAIPYGAIGIYGPAHPHSTAWVQRVKTDALGYFRTRVPSGRNEVYYMGETDGPVDMVNVTVKDGMESKVTVQAPIQAKVNAPEVVQPPRSADEKKYYGPYILPDKSKATFLFVAQGQGPNTVVVWRPDGTVAPAPAFRNDLRASGYFQSPEVEGNIWARIRVEKTRFNPSNYRIKGEGDLKSGMWTHSPDGGEHVSDISLQLLPGKSSVGSIQVLVPYGDYSTLYKGKPNRNEYRMIKGSMNRQAVQVSLPRQFLDHEVSVIAKDADGKVCEAWSSSIEQGLDKTNLTRYTYGFSKKVLADTIEVRSRKAEWIKFSGIHLQPTKK